MDGLFLITTVGLTLALLAALFVIRRTSEALDRTARGQVPSAAAPEASFRSDLDPLLPVGVVRIDGDHRIVAANDRAATLLDVKGGLTGRSVM